MALGISEDDCVEKPPYIVTGDCGMGMTHGTIAGILLTDLILGSENPWASLYSPSRKTLRAAGEYAKHALNMAVQYTDWLSGGDVSSIAEIANDSGADPLPISVPVSMRESVRV